MEFGEIFLLWTFMTSGGILLEKLFSFFSLEGA